MTSLIILGVACFVFGFTSAVILIARVSMRPNAKAVLKTIGIVKHHKAVVPQPKIEQEDMIIQ